MNETKSTVKYGIISILAVIVLTILDQWTKSLAVHYLAGNPDIPLIKGVLQLHYLENRGAAFGLMQNKVWLFVIMTSFFLIFAIYLYLKLPKTKRYLPLHIIVTVLLAGAAGNWIDRLRMGYVVDFIYFSLINFPVFNVADIYVTLSGIAIFIFVLFYYKEDDFKFLEQKKKKDD